MREAKPGPRSLSAIAEILGAEGFSDYAANQVKRYWRRRVMSPRQAGRLQGLAKAFGKIMHEKLDEGDRVVVGKYLSVLAAMQFDTGLRLGLITLVSELDEEMDEICLCPDCPKTNRK